MLAVSIGNFDGVHRGHVALIRAARAESERCGCGHGRVVAVTFEPHPVALLRPDAVPPRLTGSAERRRLLLEAGADEVVELQPTPQLLSLEPDAFIRHLRERFPFGAIVEGDDFRFGRGRSGSIESLGMLGASLGFTAREVPGVDVALADQVVVRASSSLVRWLLQRGRVADAARVLGRPYELLSVSVRGDQRGRTIGVPTLNCGPLEQLLPMDGVYGGVATLANGVQAIAAISVGTKPTFQREGSPPVRTCEAHLVDTTLPMDWYGVGMRLAFTTWIREQRRFAALEGADGLTARMRADIDAIRARARASGALAVGSDA